MRTIGKTLCGLWGLVALGALAGGCGDDAAAPCVVGPATGLAVLASDFTSTAISLLEPDGTLAKDDCIDSGTNAGGALSFTLSGDVTLPSQKQPDGELWLVDRGNAALTIVTPTTCAVHAQWSVATGFKSDPHDVAIVSSSKVYVTRYETNVAPKDANSTGDDILVLDPKTGAITGRIDLASYAAPVAGAKIQARPDRMVLFNEKVYVTLGSQDGKFLAAGEGRLVVIDPATDAVESTVALTGLKGCSALSLVEGDKKLLVACGGSFADADQAAGSGVAVVDLSVSPPTLSHVTKASAFGAQPLNFSWVAAGSLTRAFAATIGSFGDAASNTPGTNDGLFGFDTTTDTTGPIALDAGAFDLGRATLAGTRLVVPDAAADKPRVHVFEVSGVPAETAAYDPEPSKGLAPREVAWY
jgi:hypothetical protein